MIDATGLEVFGEGKQKVHKRDNKKRCLRDDRSQHSSIGSGTLVNQELFDFAAVFCESNSAILVEALFSARDRLFHLPTSFVAIISILPSRALLNLAA